MRILVAFMALILMTNCKKSEISLQKHEFGQTQKARGDLSCKQKTVAPEHKYIYNYTKSILKHLIQSNKETITGSHANVDNYCIAINPAEIVNAGASFTGDILIYAGIFSIIKEDANFAAIMAHELAHVLNDHNLFHARNSDLNSKKIGTKLAADYQNIIAQAKKYDLQYQGEFTRVIDIVDLFIIQVKEAKLKKEDFVADVTFYMDLVHAAAEKIILTNMTDRPTKIENGSQLFEAILKGEMEPAASDQMYTLYSTRQEMMWFIEPASQNDFLNTERALYKEFYDLTILEMKRAEFIEAKAQFEKEHLGLDRAANWTEEEADEVGFEIFVRSGFEVDAMIETFDLGLSKQPTKSKQSADIKEIQSQICERGAASHPAMCWRVKNFRSEYQAHKAEYDRLNGHIRNLLKGSDLNLSLVKDEIEQNKLSVRPGQLVLSDSYKVTKDCKDYYGGYGTSFNYRGKVCRKINTDWKKNGSPKYYCHL